MTLTLVRHGRTDANASGLLQGHLDRPLDELGREQAAATGRALATDTPVERIIASPLLRTRETAEAIAAACGAPVTIDDRWIELDYGEYDGVPLGEVPADVWSTWRTDATFAPPGGESISALGVRVRAALDDLCAEAVDHHLVVVSHVSPIKAAVAWALGVDDRVTWRMFLSPASITRIGVAGTGPVLQGFNATAHLQAS